MVDFMYETYIHLHQLFEEVDFLKRVEENGLSDGDSIDLDFALFSSKEEERKARLIKEQLVNDVMDRVDDWKYKVILAVSLLDESYMKYKSLCTEKEKTQQNELLFYIKKERKKS